MKKFVQMLIVMLAMFVTTNLLATDRWVCKKAGDDRSIEIVTKDKGCVVTEVKLSRSIAKDIYKSEVNFSVCEKGLAKHVTDLSRKGWTCADPKILPEPAKEEGPTKRAAPIIPDIPEKRSN
jgi:hypothetical protein